LTTARPQLSIVIPAYNEAGRIGPTLDAVLACFRETCIVLEVIVVDDGSEDDTVELVTRYAEAHSGHPVRLVRNGANRGKGYSVRHGVLEAEGEVVLFSDADGSTPFGEAGKLLSALADGQADVAIGSRAMAASDLARPQPWGRRVMGWVFRNLVRLIVVRGFQDTQCGFKAFRREVARDVFGRQTLDGFAFDVEVLFLTRRLGYRVAEVPVRWLDSRHSRVRVGRDSLKMFLDLFRIRLRALRGRYRQIQGARP